MQVSFGVILVGWVLTQPLRLSQGDLGSSVGSEVVESCIERTDLVDVPVELFLGTAVVPSSFDGRVVKVVVRRRNCEVFPMVYTVLRSKV